ncbi:MAG: exonuclease domain-containing protein, partial [Chloroflexaceae bacterium]|nr:exonuclease domain-containing protein [Chloroflexaceae bacterium]
AQLVRPKQTLPLKITRLTGITPESLADAPRFNEIGAKLAGFIKSYPLVGHSVGFDVGMLRAQGMNFNQPAYDTFDMATLLLPQASVYKLSAIAERLGIQHPEDHRALNDADVCRQVFLHLLERIHALKLGDLTEISRLTAKMHWPLRDLFDEVMRNKARNAFIEATERPSSSAKAGNGKHTPASETPLKPTGNTTPVSPDEVAVFFAPDGPLGRAFDGYEQRPPQVQMALAVADAFNQNDVRMVEAGTGTGKSMAYLVPAAMFAAQRGERVVISTNTINLQDQLFFKDIPDLQRIMREDAGAAEAPFTAALLKGRGNYLCLRRYEQLRKNDNLNDDEVRALLKVQLWLPTTQSGDKAELMLMEREQTAWGRMNVTPDTCIGPRCEHFRECYFFQARRRADAAHLLVVNHALLLADLAAQSQVLPPYTRLVVDEAHNLEDVATDQLSFEVDQAALFKFYDELHVTGGVQIVSGILSELRTIFGQGGVDESVQEKAEKIAEDMRPSVERARRTTYDCFRLLTGFVMGGVETNQYDSRLRLTPAVRRKPGWADVEAAWRNLTDSFTQIGDGLGKLETLLRETEPDSLPGYDDLLLRVEWLRRFATDVRVQTGHIIFGSEAEQTITWLNHDQNRDTLTLHAAPLSVADILQAQLFAQKETTVLASATLSVDSSFAFVKERLGLPEAEELQLESPFNYEKQALVFIPNDIPEPNQRGYQQMVEDALIKLCTATGGRTLALFTANSALRQSYAGIQDALEAQEIAVLGQGIDGSRRSILERFKEQPRTVLLGTSSFWEGVDVVGDALSVLVIAKLPFSVPSDPIFAARSEQFADPFADYSVPQSILRFKQGFGRLIRSREDRGIVVVLDKRLLTKKYGQQFLHSLPNTRVRTGPLAQLPLLAARFLV